jgi:hypothetical protein
MNGHIIKVVEGYKVLLWILYVVKVLLTDGALI